MITQTCHSVRVGKGAKLDGCAYTSLAKYHRIRISAVAPLSLGVHLDLGSHSIFRPLNEGTVGVTGQKDPWRSPPPNEDNNNNK